jgi:hypothetical protein
MLLYVQPAACAHSHDVADNGLSRFVKITSAADQQLAVAELAVWTADGANVALNKACTASVHSTDTPCSKALDGTYAAQNHPALYHSADDQVGAFLQVDLGADHRVVRVDVYNRADCCQQRLVGAVVELIAVNGTKLAQKTISAAAPATQFAFSTSIAGTIADAAVESCLAILTLVPTSGDGVYWIKPASVATPYQIYCEYAASFMPYKHCANRLFVCSMTTDGGGWNMCYSTNSVVCFRPWLTFQIISHQALVSHLFAGSFQNRDILPDRVRHEWIPLRLQQHPVQGGARRQPCQQPARLVQAEGRHTFIILVVIYRLFYDWSGLWSLDWKWCGGQHLVRLPIWCVQFRNYCARPVLLRIHSAQRCPVLESVQRLVC